MRKKKGKKSPIWPRHLQKGDPPTHMSRKETLAALLPHSNGCEVEGVAWEHIRGFLGLGCHEEVLGEKDFQRDWRGKDQIVRKKEKGM